MLGNVARHKERGRDLQMIEQAENARHADVRSILALRHRGQSRGQLGVLGECRRLAIDIEAQHEGALGSIGPDEARRWHEGSRVHRSQAMRKPRLSRFVSGVAKSRQALRSRRGM